MVSKYDYACQKCGLAIGDLASDKPLRQRVADAASEFLAVKEDQVPPSARDAYRQFRIRASAVEGGAGTAWDATLATVSDAEVGKLRDLLVQFICETYRCAASE